jgi:hypothetical protein
MPRRATGINNLPGTAAFCPMIRRTGTLDAYRDRAFYARARETAGPIRPDLLSRAAAFLLLNDSKSSFAIEGERPSGTRASRWGQAIAQAGNRPLSLAELDRLQRIVIGDDRFVRLGLREEGGTVGARDRDTRMPVPNHISARAADLLSLVHGVIEYTARAIGQGMDRSRPQPRSPSASFISTPMWMRMAASTAGCFTMRWRLPGSIRPG